MATLRRAGLIVLAVLALSLAPPAPQLSWGPSDEVTPSSIGGPGGRAWAAPVADASSTLIAIDAPRGGNTSTQLEVRGWAADPSARGGTGVDRVEVYLDGERDAGGTRLGRTLSTSTRIRATSPPIRAGQRQSRRRSWPSPARRRPAVWRAPGAAS